MASEIPTLDLKVRTVVGDPGPLGSVFIIPLLSDWHVPRQCVWNLTGETCERLLHFIYVLDEPLHGFGGGGDGFKTVGICKAHHEKLLHNGNEDQPDEEPPDGE